jgi:hypothetical protein
MLPRYKIRWFPAFVVEVTEKNVLIEEENGQRHRLYLLDNQLFLQKGDLGIAWVSDGWSESGRLGRFRDTEEKGLVAFRRAS